ncbi:helix-turn-helix domain-containing protein [Glycomyces arizonensis]|uniref:helix-turn-helix domain-containing protein n=1 Tax=Glycomyces arizonensis TaxID=256035 RepID=UPI0012EB8196|nr:helix-turn-helix domain-containing protein [Glycomyces arizonensis]
MKALAHPARMAVFDFLGTRRIQGFDGATATEIAEVVGMTPSAMSYHLRTLAKAGFIEEAPSRGDARERVWRLGFSSFSIRAREGASESEKVVERTMVETFTEQHLRHFRRWLEVRDQVEPELREASTVDTGRLRLTLAEADEYQRRYRELEAEYARISLYRAEKGVDADDGTVVFHVRLELFPEV